jgi:hypothetical protein
MLTLTVCCLSWGPWHVQTRAIDTGGNTDRQAICPLRKELWLAGCLGVEPREMGSIWLRAWATLGGGIILAEGLHDWGMRAVPLLSYTLAFSLQLRKSTQNLSQGSCDKAESESESLYDWRSVSLSWCRVPFGAHDQILVFRHDCFVLSSFYGGAPSLTRGWVCHVSYVSVFVLFTYFRYIYIHNLQ